MIEAKETHKHTYVLHMENGTGEMVCDCGRYLRVEYKGAVLVED